MAAVLVAACGSRQPYSRLLAAQAGTSGGGGLPGSGGSLTAGAGVGSGNSSGSGASGEGGAAGLGLGGSGVAGGVAGAGTAAVTGTGTGANSGGGGTLAQPSGAAASPCASPKSTIAIGSVGEQSGVAGAAVADGPKAVAAWVQYVNATQGGVACHPLKYIIADDGGDPSRNQALTEQLVQQDHVLAFVQNDAPLAAAGSESYLVSHDIPVIGSEGAEQFYYQYPNFFPQASSGNALALAVLDGLTKVLTPAQRAHFGALSCIEAAECSNFGKVAAADAGKAGLTLVYNGSASLVAPDFTSQCEAAKQAGATVLGLAMDPNSIHRIGSSCAGVGYHPQLAISGAITTPDLASDLNLAGMMSVVVVAPWTATNIPAVALYQKVLGQYGVGVQLDGSSIEGWASAELFAAGTMNLPDNPTSQDVINGLDTIKNNDLGGLTGPLTFSKGQNAPVETCWWHLQLRNGKFFSPDNGQRACQ
ncbi:MAG TPA: ABC transporter substrate-binding protein [Acidimicrobiales bacterium]|nr:ABC transporter substrate-binding protein [Acidimicrobiales bacterium]